MKSKFEMLLIFKTLSQKFYGRNAKEWEGNHLIKISITNLYFKIL